MSHIVTIVAEIRDHTALTAACRRQGLAAPKQQTIKMFAAEVSGMTVQLPDWKYPVVCEFNSGRVHFDNFGGRWGKQVHLDRLLQNYAVEKTHLEARKAGHTVTEQQLDNGSIKLCVQVAGAV